MIRSLYFFFSYKTHSISFQSFVSPCKVHLVFLWYRIRQNVTTWADGDMGVSRPTQDRWGGCCCGCLLGMLQPFPVHLPLFCTPILKPYLYLSLWEAQCHRQLTLSPHCDISVVLKLLLQLQTLVVCVHHPVLFLSASFPPWYRRPGRFKGSPLGAEGVLSGDEVVVVEGPSSSRNRGVAQLWRGIAELCRAGAWPLVQAVWIVVP